MLSAATPTRGGLAVALARSAMAGALGADLDLAAATGNAPLDDDIALFSESNGRFVVTVPPARAEAFAERFAGFACRRAGEVIGDDRLVVRSADRTVLDVPVEELRARFKKGLADA